MVTQQEPSTVVPTLTLELVSQEHLSVLSFLSAIHKDLPRPLSVNPSVLISKVSPVDGVPFTHCRCFSTITKQCDPCIYFCTAAEVLPSIDVLLICLLWCSEKECMINTSSLHPQPSALTSLLKKDNAYSSRLLVWGWHCFSAQSTVYVYAMY